MYECWGLEVVPSSTKDRPESSEKVIQMGRKNTNHAHDGSAPTPTHQIKQKKAHGQVFGLDLHHVEAHISSTIGL